MAARLPKQLNWWPVWNARANWPNWWPKANWPPIDESEPGEPRFPIDNIPFHRNLNFTGRKDHLQTLAQALQQPPDHLTTRPIDYPTKRPTPHPTIFILAGLGGVGKTQLALEYCYRHKDGYDVIWWLRADETAMLAADLIELGRTMGLPVEGIGEQSAALAVVRRWLEGSERRWLLVCDNADAVNPDDLRPYLPRSRPGHMLVTSRNPVWGRLARVLAVGVFEPDEAIDFLLARTGRDEHEEAAALAEALGYLPLAL